MTETAAPAIMVLGPSEWLSAGLPSIFKVEHKTPLDARKEVAVFLRELGVPVILMEEHKRREGDSNFDLFRRLLVEHNVKTYLIVWPLGSKLHGLNIEVGYLLTCISNESITPDDIFLLIEQDVVEIQEERGELVLSINEPGNRTRYYGDLADADCPMLIWDTAAGLKLNALNVALAHVRRHGIAAPPASTSASARADEKST